MAKKDKQLWQGLTAGAQKALAMRDYAPQSFADRLSGAGVEAGQLASADRTSPENRKVWIPGVEVFPAKSIISGIAAFSASLSAGMKGC